MRTVGCLLCLLCHFRLFIPSLPASTSNHNRRPTHRRPTHQPQSTTPARPQRVTPTPARARRWRPSARPSASRGRGWWGRPTLRAGGCTRRLCVVALQSLLWALRSLLWVGVGVGWGWGWSGSSSEAALPVQTSICAPTTSTTTFNQQCQSTTSTTHNNHPHQSPKATGASSGPVRPQAPGWASLKRRATPSGCRGPLRRAGAWTPSSAAAPRRAR